MRSTLRCERDLVLSKIVAMCLSAETRTKLYPSMLFRYCRMFKTILHLIGLQFSQKGLNETATSEPFFMSLPNLYSFSLTMALFFVEIMQISV